MTNINFIYNKFQMNISLNSYVSSGKSRYEKTNQEEYESYNRISSSSAINNNDTYNLRGNTDYQISSKTKTGALDTYNKNRSENDLDGKSEFYSKTKLQTDPVLLSENTNNVTDENYRIGTYLDIVVDTLGRKNTNIVK